MWSRIVWAHQCSFQAGSIMIASAHNQHTLFLVQFFCQLLNLIIQTENLFYQIYAKQKHYDWVVFNLTVARLGFLSVLPFWLCQWAACQQLYSFVQRWCTTFLSITTVHGSDCENCDLISTHGEEEIQRRILGSVQDSYFWQYRQPVERAGLWPNRRWRGWKKAGVAWDTKWPYYELCKFTYSQKGF